MGSGEREHPPPAWHKSWHRPWPRGWAGEGEGPEALGSPSLGTSCPSLGHRVPQFPRVYSGVGAVWSPWAACGAAWQRDPGLFAPVSSALPSPVSLPSPRAGDGVALQGRSGLFCTLGPSASGIYSPSSRLLPPPPDSHTGAGVSKGQSTPGLLKPPGSVPSHTEKGRIIPPSPARLCGARLGDPQTPPAVGHLASSPERGFVLPLGKTRRRPAPVFFPVGSRSRDAGEAGGCSALLPSCPGAVPAWAGRTRCLCGIEGTLSSASAPSSSSSPLHPQGSP